MTEYFRKTQLRKPDTVFELIVIHPFREGNGRAARLLADLMVFQADLPPLNFTAIDQTENAEGFNQYIFAIHEGVCGDYEPIRKIFLTLLRQSIP